MDVKSCQIAIDGKTSSAVDLEDCEILGLILPTLVSGALTFEVSSALAGDYVELQSKSLSALEISATTGDIAIASDDLVGLKGYRYVKVVSATTQTITARTFTWLLKKNWRR